jgi:hypothetical protein
LGDRGVDREMKALAVAVLLVFASTASAELCASPRGMLRLRDVCKPRETAVQMAPMWVDATGRPAGSYDAGALIFRGPSGLLRIEVDRASGAISRPPWPGLMAFYQAPDCQGPMLLRASTELLPRAFAIADRPDVLFVAPETESPTAVQSYWDDVFYACVNRALTMPVGPAVEIAIPFVEPLEVR